ncbi:MAG: hypothetical protein LBE20_03570 [Deltaproteobacteria bacterium]|jgi:hypothetical protein|nr:hypothetical protein [Deltaproteobacteria bacterium]
MGNENNPKTTIIRASSLPHYTDCTRRAAAKMFFKELAQYGFKINKLQISIGAAVGTATHKSLETALLLIKDGCDYIQPMRETAAESIEQSIAYGVIWDDTTRKKDDAINQAVRMAHAVLGAISFLTAVKIEEEYTADFGDNFIISGHIDIRSEGEIWDLKTGTVHRANQAQYGCYSLLCRSNGIGINKIGEIYIKRVGIIKPQPEPIIVEYSVKEAELIAYQIIQKIKSDLQKFRQNGDIWAWLPNPNSMMCTPDYCPAWGTDFCKSHKKINFNNLNKEI